MLCVSLGPYDADFKDSITCTRERSDFVISKKGAYLRRGDDICIGTPEVTKYGLNLRAASLSDTALPLFVARYGFPTAGRTLFYLAC